ncbi:MAG: sugar ABC transporter permease [Elusimicrobiota bacterium]|nr:sugar ABC transporter permease [Endomicrobiia bacterium]MDW8165581.1 sugar ABC transporter permease [Elusimicrobiota bacterium]
MKIRKFKKQLISYLFILPAFLILTIFVFIPVIASFFLSFTEYDGISPPKLVGFKNYINILFNDKLFWKAVFNTIYYVIFTVPLGIACSLVVAMALFQKIKFSTFFRTGFFLPTVTSVAAISVVWRWIYAGDRYGLLNYVLTKLGILAVLQDWLMQPSTTLPAIILMSIWGGIGYNTIILLAGLQSIPDSVFEAAKIDGATSWERFWYIILPMLKPVMIFLVIMSTINSFQVFEQVYIMASTTEYFGGVLYSALTIVPYLYERAFKRFMLGYASALAYLLFAIIFVITLIYMKISKFYEQ